MHTPSQERLNAGRAGFHRSGHHQPDGTSGGAARHSGSGPGTPSPQISSRSKRWSTSRRRRRFRSRASTAWSRFTRCSICSRRETTPSAFAGARPATPEVRATCCRACVWNSAWPGGRKRKSARPTRLLLTTPDQKFTVRTVACFGQCALAPVVEVNHRICGHVNERTLQREIQHA